MKSSNFKLDNEDSFYLVDFVRKSKEVVRSIVLIFLNKSMTNIEIADLLGISPRTVSRIKSKYLTGGLEVALYDNPRSGQPKKYGDREEAEIIALACSDPPKGRKSWSIRLITKTLKGKEGFETLNRETVRLVLKKQNKALEKKNVVHSKN